ncbi:MAG: hypothetical protein RXR31_05860 [Thermoproteota archaeon]
MIDEKKIKIEPLEASFQIGFKYGKKEGTVVIDDEFDNGVDAYISDENFEYTDEEENEIIRLVFEKFLKEFSEKMKKDVE